jgi:predicted nucleic acid-binding protein
VAPRGRVPGARGVFELEQASLFVPAEVVLDTSFVAHALITSQPHHETCSAYLTRLAEDGSRIWFNRLLELELREVAFRIGLIERHGKRWSKYRHDGRARRHAAALLADVEQSWSRVLDATRWARIELHEVSDAVSPLMRAFGLSSYDAVHAATAIAADVSNLATLDTGFAAIPARQLQIHTDRGRARRCRELRGM